VLESIVTFEVRGEWFGVRARDVREVAQLRGVRPVPRAPRSIAGLAEVHGRLVTLLDLERLLPAPHASGPSVPRDEAVPRGRDEFGVVLAAPYDHLGILSRTEVDVTSASLDADSAAAGAASWLQERVPLGDRLLNLLSLPALVSRVETRIIRSFQPGSSTGTEES
jgi:purine-binding chemotaxis protein CheW